MQFIQISSSLFAAVERPVENQHINSSDDVVMAIATLAQLRAVSRHHPGISNEELNHIYLSFCFDLHKCIECVA